jgi:phosphatidylglycerophosphatase A
MTPAAMISTVFGIGRAPGAPGSVASILAVPVAAVIQYFTGFYGVLIASALAFAIGVWASEVYARECGDDDPSDCVIDEVAGQWLACAIALPSWLGYLIALLLFRLFDISKTWPVSLAERLPGGWGIMADDIVAGLIAGGIVALLANAGLI